MPPEFTETMPKSQKLFDGSLGVTSNNGCKLGRNNAADHKQVNPNSETVTSEKLTVPGYSSSPMPLKNNYYWSGYTYPYDGSLHSVSNGLYYPTLGFPRVSMPMFPRSYLHEQTIQEFHYFVVIDFEATCDKEKNPHPQEIIEFPSVLVNGRTGQMEDCFQIYVRPTYNKQLTEFCKELTGINQSQVDGGFLLSDALLMHDKWLEYKGIKLTNFAIVTWSDWDCRVMLESECRFKKIRKPSYFDRWINLKVPFSEVYGQSRYNLKEAVELAGLKWEGRSHCGLDDAKNTARLLTHLIHHGSKISITNSLIWQSADHPHALHQQSSSQSEYGFPYQPYSPPIVFQLTQLAKPVKHSLVRCFCGTTSLKFLKPGPNGGSSCYFRCGNWTANGGARCTFVIPTSETAETG